MRKIRRSMAGLLLAALAVGSVHAVAASDDGGEAEAKCRWVKRIGLVCDTELSTVNI
jgi:hypothetical protein